MTKQQAGKGWLKHGVAREMTGAASMKDRIPGLTREQQLRAVNTVCAWIPAGPDRDTVLAVLFQPPYRTPPHSGTRTHESVVRFDQAAWEADRQAALEWAES